MKALLLGCDRGTPLRLGTCTTAPSSTERPEDSLARRNTNVNEKDPHHAAFRLMVGDSSMAEL